MSCELYENKIVTARKDHWCEFCRKKIAKGEKYSREKGLYDNEFFERILCIPCNKMLDEFVSEVDSEFDWPEIRDYLQDEHCTKCPHYWADDCDDSPEDCPTIREKYGEKHA